MGGSAHRLPDIRMTASHAPRRPVSHTVRQGLRDGLAGLHGELDGRVSAACLQPQPDMRRLLALHAAALPPLVTGLDAAGAAELWPEWDEPARLLAIAADLRALGMAPPGPAMPIRFARGAEVWGGLYALLGSRLGNRIVLRHFAEAGAPSASAFLRFGEADRGLWPRFLTALETSPIATALDALQEGGRRVMQRYLDVLAACPDPALPPGIHRPDAAVPA
jgi:heme oxygenase